MNNNIIKSLRCTLFGTVAAAVVSIGFTACADEMFETQNSTAPTNSYKISIPASIGGGDTRAIAYNSQTGGYDATFETTDKIYVYNLTKDAGGAKKDEYGSWNITYLYPDANGKKANLVGELAFATWNQQSWSYVEEITPEVGDELMLFYNSRDKELYYNRDYTGYYFANNSCDYAIANVQITSIKDGVITTGPSSFQNPQSICKINFTGIGSGVKIKNVKISSAKSKIVSNYYPTRKEHPEDFSNVNYIYEGEGTSQHELTFMLRFSNNPDYSSTPGDVITFMALGSDDHYYIGTKSVSSDLENGKYYHADLAMTDMGLAMTLTNNTTRELVELDSWNDISSKDAAYTLANTGFDKGFSWYGGENALTLKNVSLQNKGNAIYVESKESEDTRMHYLKLDGVNTLICSNGKYSPDAIAVYENSSLTISAVSTDGKLNISGMSINNNARMILESGEMTVNGYTRIGDNSILKVDGGVLTIDEIGGNENSRCIISKDGKVRIPKDADVRKGLIKAASGYVLNTATEDDYTVFTVSKAPDPIALSAVTSNDLGKIIGSDGNVYVPNYSLSDNIRPVGMIASISSTGHGLAIAMEAIRKNSDDNRNGFSWDNSGEANDGKTATEIFQNWATNNEVSFGTWRIPSKSDCQDMILGCRIDGDATVASDENMTSNGFGTKLVAAGICTDDYFYFGTWTSTSGQDGEIYLGTNKSENGSFVAGFYNNSFSSTTTIFPVLEF